MDWTWLTERAFLGTPILRWLLALAVTIIVMVAIRVVRGFARRRMRAHAEGTASIYDDVVSNLLGGVNSVFILVVGLYAGSRTLLLDPATAAAIHTIFVLVVIVQVALWGNRALATVMQHYRGREGLDASRRTTLSALTWLGRLAFFSLLLLLGLDNLGVDVTALVAGLGIGALAIGLALQNVLGDLFASLSIVFDKPFDIGDFVKAGDTLGTVEHVGLRTTRVRSLSGEQVIVPNSDLVNSRIQNYQRMQERRVVITLGVTYQTPLERLREIPGLVREIIEAQEPVRFDRAHFCAYGAFSLDFEIVYWVLEPDYALHMDVQQAINLAIFEAFAERGVEFAYPSQTIFVEGGGASGDGAGSLEPVQGP